MVHLTILLSVSFIIQIIGYIHLRRDILSRSDNIDIVDLKKVVKKNSNYIVLGLVIQFIVIISQISVYFLFVRNLG